MDETMAADAGNIAKGRVKRAKTDKQEEEKLEVGEWAVPPHSGVIVKTVEMHAGGEPLRIFRLKDQELGESLSNYELGHFFVWKRFQ